MMRILCRFLRKQDSRPKKVKLCCKLVKKISKKRAKKLKLKKKRNRELKLTKRNDFKVLIN